jgi:hypothetical protein
MYTYIYINITSGGNNIDASFKTDNIDASFKTDKIDASLKTDNIDASLKTDKIDASFKTDNVDASVSLNCFPFVSNTKQIIWMLPLKQKILMFPTQNVFLSRLPPRETRKEAHLIQRQIFPRTEIHSPCDPRGARKVIAVRISRYIVGILMNPVPATAYAPAPPPLAPRPPAPRPPAPRMHIPIPAPNHASAPTNAFGPHPIPCSHPAHASHPAFAPTAAPQVLSSHVVRIYTCLGFRV